jgi:hypothetical protein
MAYARRWATVSKRDDECSAQAFCACSGKGYSELGRVKVLLGPPGKPKGNDLRRLDKPGGIISGASCVNNEVNSWQSFCATFARMTRLDRCDSGATRLMSRSRPCLSLKLTVTHRQHGGDCAAQSYSQLKDEQDQCELSTRGEATGKKELTYLSFVQRPTSIPTLASA